MKAEVTLAIIKKNHTWSESVVIATGANWVNTIANAEFDYRLSHGICDAEVLSVKAIRGKIIEE